MTQGYWSYEQRKKSAHTMIEEVMFAIRRERREQRMSEDFMSMAPQVINQGLMSILPWKDEGCLPWKRKAAGMTHD